MLDEQEPDLLHEDRIRERAHRDVDGDRDAMAVFPPCGTRRQRLTEDERRELADEIGVLGRVDEVARHGDAPVRVAPADECLEADRLPTAERDLRLVLNHELAASQRFTEITQDTKSCGRLARPRRRGTVRLLLAEDVIGGRLQQRLGVGTGVRRCHRPDDGRHRHRHAVDLDGTLEDRRRMRSTVSLSVGWAPSSTTVN